MYQFLRNSHLALGLFFSTFVLMFGISSVRFAHPGWFSNEPAKNSSLTLALGSETSPRSLAQRLMEENGLRGVPRP